MENTKHDDRLTREVNLTEVKAKTTESGYVCVKRCGFSVDLNSTQVGLRYFCTVKLFFKCYVFPDS